MHYMKVFADYISSYSDSADSYPYVKSEISFFNLMAQDFKDSLASGITAEEIGVVNPDVMDFRSHILKLKKAHKKNIGLFLLPEQIISFVRQANAMGAEFTYFGTDLFESAAIITSTEKLLEGSLYPDHEVRNEFRKMYFEEFGNEAQITFAANGYEIALLFGELLGNMGSYSSDSLIQSLKQVQGRSSSMGDFSYKHDQENGAYFDFPIEVKKIVGSKGVVVR
jgi:ABC-type branched-subunit amino acid transport system substrate-binding protein